jgi:hypothetical protein
MIAIINTKKVVNGRSEYRLQINEKVICKFLHKKEKGLAACLKEAAKAAEKEELKFFLDLWNPK